jgi:hypothetical protein
MRLRCGPACSRFDAYRSALPFGFEMASPFGVLLYENKR